jgi:GNAT superfamily N-acetyltransferase
VHELAVRRRFSGIDLGRKILELASDMAREEGKQFLRLDCMYENPRLRQYYADCGFRFLGQHPQHAWYALFEKELT